MAEAKIEHLRSLFPKYQIDGYLIPHSDEHQNEYVPNSSARLEYITEFSVSNGFAIITKNKQYFWTDPRYLTQARAHMPDFEFCKRDFASIKKTNISMRIGYNPMLFTESQIAAFAKDITFVPISTDLIDEIWDSKPELPNIPAYSYDIKYAGMDSKSKLELVRKNFLDKAEYALITEPDSICWLLNIRGCDIPYVPVILSYMIISQKHAICFTDLRKIPAEIQNALDFVEFKNKEELPNILHSIKETLLIDPVFCSLGLQGFIKNKIEGLNPCLIPKACKNQTELDWMQKGHIKDAAALCTGLAWAQNTKNITEQDIAEKLTSLRSKQDGYVMDSFPAIVGFKGNGALIHYKIDKEKPTIIEGNGLLLIDSGAHYLGCTTDVTRVLAFGTPTHEQKLRYTQVLKGHIALANLCVPSGTIGGTLDALARGPLWNHGLNYSHGTGHGVGAMLNVHEYPRYIWSSRSNAALMEGMVMSDEPGFYKEGEYGIRIENMLYIKKSKYPGFIESEMLTLVPYERYLIDFSILDDLEKDYLRRYYERIKRHVLPLLEEEAYKWCKHQLDIEI